MATMETMEEMEKSLQLVEACRKLEESLKRAVVGAVSCSRVETAEKPLEKQIHIVRKMLANASLLNSRRILLNAILAKDQVILPEDASLRDVELNLNCSNKMRTNWSDALKMKAFSRTIYAALQPANRQKNKTLDSLLIKFSNLDIVLNELNSMEELKKKELSEARSKSYHITTQWMAKKKAHENRPKSTASSSNDKLSSQMSRLLAKMETIMSIQRKLLDSCTTYDWIRDSEQLEQYVISASRRPYKASDFL